MDPSTCTRVVEIMSGRTNPQQGLVTTCKDYVYNVIIEGTWRGLVWRMSQYERRRGGNALPDDL